MLNKYFNFETYDPEQDLLEELVIENIQMTGFNIYYLPRDVISIDKILGEPGLSLFTHAYFIEARIAEPRGNPSAFDAMTKFGIRYGNEMTLIVSKKRFLEIVDNEARRPNEGDLIYLGRNDTHVNIHELYEITHVIKENPYWVLGRNYSYQFTCAQIELNLDDKLDTSVDSIQKFVEMYSDTKELDKGINSDLYEKRKDLIDFTEENPFGAF